MTKWRIRRSGLVFIAGVGVWGFYHETMQAQFENEWVFVGCMVAYFVILRQLSLGFDKDRGGTNSEPEDGPGQ